MPSVGTSPGQYYESSSSRSLGPRAEPAEKAFFCADLDGEFVSCNAAFSRLLGYTPEELTGRDFSALFGGKGQCFDCHSADSHGDSAIGAFQLKRSFSL